MSRELIQKAQHELLGARVQVESTFLEPLPETVLAHMARLHGQLTGVFFTLQDALAETMLAEAQLPDIQPQPKATKPKPESKRRNERRNLQKARETAAKADKSKPVASTPMQLADRLGVECPLCHSKRGEFCVVMTTNSKRTDRILKIGGGTHDVRADAAREAKRKGKLQPWTPPLVDEPQITHSEPEEEPAHFDDGTPMDPPLTDEQILDALGETFPGSEMVVIDGVGVDVDRVRALVNGA